MGTPTALEGGKSWKMVACRMSLVRMTCSRGSRGSSNVITKCFSRCSSFLSDMLVDQTNQKGRSCPCFLPSLLWIDLENDNDLLYPFLLPFSNEMDTSIPSTTDMVMDSIMTMMMDEDDSSTSKNSTAMASFCRPMMGGGGMVRVYSSRFPFSFFLEIT